MPEGTAIRPAATLVLLRESAGQLETLLLRRKSKSGKGAWVFPGGVVEPQDGGDGDERKPLQTVALLHIAASIARAGRPINHL